MERYGVSEARRIAAKWREAGGYVGRGGVVVGYGGEVCGRGDCLRNPEHWRPDAVAIDEAGGVYVAEGGNSADGAVRWVLLGAGV